MAWWKRHADSPRYPMGSTAQPEIHVRDAVPFRDGDHLLVEVTGTFAQDQVERLRAGLEERFPHNAFTILAGAHVAAIKKP